MNIAFYTLGCKVNQYESRSIAEQLAAAGHHIIQGTDGADAVVINSCTVTAESDRKTRQAVRRFRRKLPEAVIILAGCMPQAFPDEAAGLSEADIVTGNVSPERIPALLEEFLKNGQRILEIEPHAHKESYTTPAITDFGDRTRAFMKIEDGCDRFCTYCIIPKARGEVRSKPLAEISAEAERLAAAGFCEIVLVGINLTSYGKDCGLSICDAVDAAARPDGIRRVRLGSLEPDHISDGTLDRLLAQKKFCPQFHLALQSGCDRTLKRMNRHYDTAFYSDLADRIRKKFPNASVTTDVMVGFAGETEEEFAQNAEFVEKIGFARAHVFAYSRRAGTVAAGLPDQVSGAEKERRAAVMGETARRCEAAFLKTQVGRTEEVLFETYKNGVAEGYTANYTRVKAASGRSLQGEIKRVLLTAAADDFCFGELL